MSLWARGKRPVQDGAVVLIQASGRTELHCQHAVARQLAPGPRQKRRNRVSTRSLAHMAPPVDHFQIRRGAQLLVPMLDDAVLQPGLSRRQAEEDIVVDPELGADPAAAGLGRDPVAPALWHQLRHSWTLQSPLTDSNRRPPPYHALRSATDRNPWQRFWLAPAVFGGVRICHRLRLVATAGLHKRSIPAAGSLRGS